MRRYPLVLGSPRACEGYVGQVERVLRRVDQEPLIAERVTSIELMMALVSAGYALGLGGASRTAATRELGVLARPLAGWTPMLTTYLLHLASETAETLAHFIEGVHTLKSAGGRSL